jgi:hypothetical protein
VPVLPPDDDPAQARAQASRALTEALRAVADANERLQFAAAWVLDAFGDSVDAETVRMLMPGRRSGRPPVPPAAPAASYGDEPAVSITAPPLCTREPGCWAAEGYGGLCFTCGEEVVVFE